jgi:hypothetical protein
MRVEFGPKDFDIDLSEKTSPIKTTLILLGISLPSAKGEILRKSFSPEPSAGAWKTASFSIATRLRSLERILRAEVHALPVGLRFPIPLCHSGSNLRAMVTFVFTETAVKKSSSIGENLARGVLFGRRS